MKINKIELLPDVKDELIERITISIRLDALNETMLAELTSLIKDNPGKAELLFQIKDMESLTQANLYSQNTKLRVGKELINYLKSQSAIEFSINQ